ncbi:MAG: hypothetical protein ACM30E_06860 [Nitrososphaerales archaeon]
MEPTKQKNYALKRAAAIGVLFVGAAAARIFWVNQVRAQWGEEPFYTWMSGSHAPLFPAFAGWLARSLASIGLTGAVALELSTVLIYVLFGGLLVAPVYGIARRMGSEAMAAGAGLATVFYPAMLGNFPQAAAIVEPMYLLLVAAAWYFLLVAVDEMTLWPAAIGGLFVGLAYLTRPEALFYLAFALGLLLVATWLSRKQSLPLRRALANIGIALVMFALIAGPYLATLFQARL